jgi:hypothetical protein
MTVIIIGGGPFEDPHMQENEKLVLEWTHLYRSFGLSSALVIMYGDKPDLPTPSDYDVAVGLAKESVEVYQAIGKLPTILPIIGVIPEGTKFAGQRYALKVVPMDEALQDLQQKKEVPG